MFIPLGFIFFMFGLYGFCKLVGDWSNSPDSKPTKTLQQMIDEDK